MDFVCLPPSFLSVALEKEKQHLWTFAVAVMKCLEICGFATRLRLRGTGTVAHPAGVRCNVRAAACTLLWPPIGPHSQLCWGPDVEESSAPFLSLQNLEQQVILVCLTHSTVQRVETA